MGWREDFLEINRGHHVKKFGNHWFRGSANIANDHFK